MGHLRIWFSVMKQAGLLQLLVKWLVTQINLLFNADSMKMIYRRPIIMAVSFSKPTTKSIRKYRLSDRNSVKIGPFRISRCRIRPYSYVWNGHCLVTSTKIKSFLQQTITRLFIEMNADFFLDFSRFYSWSAGNLFVGFPWVFDFRWFLIGDLVYLAFAWPLKQLYYPNSLTPILFGYHHLQKLQKQYSKVR